MIAWGCEPCYNDDCINYGEDGHENGKTCSECKFYHLDPRFFRKSRDMYKIRKTK